MALLINLFMAFLFTMLCHYVITLLNIMSIHHCIKLIMALLINLFMAFLFQFHIVQGMTVLLLAAISEVSCIGSPRGTCTKTHYDKEGKHDWKQEYLPFCAGSEA